MIATSDFTTTDNKAREANGPAPSFPPKLHPEFSKRVALEERLKRVKEEHRRELLILSRRRITRGALLVILTGILGYLVGLGHGARFFAWARAEASGWATFQQGEVKP